MLFQIKANGKNQMHLKLMVFLPQKINDQYCGWLILHFSRKYKIMQMRNITFCKDSYFQLNSDSVTSTTRLWLLDLLVDDS